MTVAMETVVVLVACLAVWVFALMAAIRWLGFRLWRLIPQSWRVRWYHSRMFPRRYVGTICGACEMCRANMPRSQAPGRFAVRLKPCERCGHYACLVGLVA